MTSILQDAAGALQDARRLSLTHTPSVAEAIRLAECLGTNVTGVVPRVGLPGEWVLDQQVGPAAVAAWAAAHCTSADALDAIAHSGGLRLGVRKALLGNANLREHTAQVLRTAASTGESYSEVAEIKCARAEARRLMHLKKLHWTMHEDCYRVIRFLIARGETSIVDEFIRETAARGNTEFTRERLLHYYVPGNDYVGANDDIYMHATTTPVEAFMQVRQGDRTQVAGIIVAQLCSSKTTPRVLLADEILEWAVNSRTSNSWTFENNLPPLLSWVTSAGASTVRSSPRWAHLARLADLTDADLADMALSTYKENRGGIAQMLLRSSDYHRVPMLLSLIPEGTFLACSDNTFGHFVRALSEIDEEEVTARFVARLSYDRTLQVLTNAIYCDEGTEECTPIVPPEWVPQLAAQLQGFVNAQQPPECWFDSVVPQILGRLSATPPELQCALVEHVPGLAGRITPDSPNGAGVPGRFIIETLADTGLSLEAAVSMLYEHTDSSLVAIRKICTAVAS